MKEAEQSIALLGNRLLMVAIDWLVAIDWSGKSAKMLTNTKAASRMSNSVSFSIPESPSLIPKSSKVPILLPKGFLPNLSVRDYPAAIRVKISSMVEEEFKFLECRSLDFSLIKCSRLDPTDHKGISLLLNRLGCVLIVCNTNKK